MGRGWASCVLCTKSRHRWLDKAIRPLNLVTLAGKSRGKITVAALASSSFRRYRRAGAAAR